MISRAGETIHSNAVAIGASAGGVTALRALLSALPNDFPAPIAVVQHVASESRADVALVYGGGGGVGAREGEDKASLRPGEAVFAPPGYHMLIESDGSIALSVEEPVRHSRPSIDVMFESVARAYGPRAIAVLLTGANEDGAAGIAAVKAAGGRCIVQDPQDAEWPMMPAAALALSVPDAILPLSRIAGALVEWTRTNRGRNG